MTVNELVEWLIVVECNTCHVVKDGVTGVFEFMGREEW